MCGIFGFLDRDGLRLKRSLLEACRDRMTHRGPDSAGSYEDSTTYLGFRRLAIQDLSREADQPMASKDGRVWIVFNGEVYNFVELRMVLESQGHSFRSTSDTEVLLAMYREHGTDMFQHLNGMFSIAIYDTCQKTVLLARDRLGKKPLFYWRNGGTFAFASELKALRLLPGFPRDLDPLALGIYSKVGWIPNWISIHPGVRKLAPGSWLKWDLRADEIVGPVAYWSLPTVEVDEAMSETQWLDSIESTLWEATRVRLRSDVPVGVLLSGGIDSGLVAAAAALHSPNSMQTLTIGFRDWSQSEWPVAQRVAQHIGVVPVQREIEAGSSTLLPGVMAHFDEPFSDASALPTELICETARKHVTVVLSGDGGDELFAGYDNHVRAWAYRHLDVIPAKIRSAVASALIPTTAKDSLYRRFLQRLSQPVGRWGLGAKLYLYEDWMEDSLNPTYLLAHKEMNDHFERHYDQWLGASAIDQAQRLDIRLYMLDDILVKVDRMSMRHSLEVRSPFLDHRLVELAMRIPARLRVRHRQNKYLLRRLAKRHLPSEVVNAPKKGFGIPLRDWIFETPLSNEFRELVCDSDGPDDLLCPGGGEKLWEQARYNTALVPAVFRVLAYKWWKSGLRFAL